MRRTKTAVVLSTITSLKLKFRQPLLQRRIPYFSRGVIKPCSYFNLAFDLHFYIIKQKHVIVEIENKIKVCAWFNNTTTNIWGSSLKKNIYRGLRTCYHSGKSRYRRSFTTLFQLRRKLSKRILSLYRSIIMPLVCMHLYTSLVSFVFSSPFSALRF